ncbi:MAG: 5-formyltetrahydrofolate cyclo-ligase [Burkholderiaceae bacterium]|nr:5-formyltetrahydrofolate cyclo-ligase [Burkholderiaceae bacterium]
MKQELRRALLAKRQAIAPELRAHYDAAIGARLLAWWQRHPVRTLGVYWPIRGEADLLPTYAELASSGVRLALPVVERDAPLRFAAWTPGDVLAPGAMKVPEPLPPHIPLEPEAVLVPCVGFNDGRYRLGYGGGFYDRTLAASPRPLAIGIAYTCGEARFDAAGHDIALDAVITETAILSGEQDC